MPNLKNIRSRISSAGQTRKITSAMKMISAVKLRKSQDKLVNLRPYAEKLKSIVLHVNSMLSEKTKINSPYIEKRDVKKVLILAITSDKGLCGGYNTSVMKEAINLVVDKHSEHYGSGNIDFYIIGNKGIKIANELNFHIVHSKVDMDNVDFHESKEIAKELMDLFEKDKYQKVYLVYSKFKNSANSIPTHELLMPVVPEPPHTAKALSSHKDDYIFEPSIDKIAEELIPLLIYNRIYVAFCNALSSENGARMTSMYQATDNADELIGNLNLAYNKLRQTSITNEILEVTSGAESLN
ncbi:MAG: ATP synthase F1 subunit gamma [Bacteroidales bacterium]